MTVVNYSISFHEKKKQQLERLSIYRADKYSRIYEHDKFDNICSVKTLKYEWFVLEGVSRKQISKQIHYVLFLSLHYRFGFDVASFSVSSICRHTHTCDPLTDAMPRKPMSLFSNEPPYECQSEWNMQRRIE